MKEQQKLDLLKNFGKIFKKKEFDKTKIPQDKLQGYFNPDCTICIIPKTEYLKRIIDANFHVVPVTIEQTQKILNNLNYMAHILSKDGVQKWRVVNRLEGKENKEAELKSKFSTKLIEPVLKLCKHYDTVTFKLKLDYPLWAETNDLICIIAPRIED